MPHGNGEGAASLSADRDRALSLVPVAQATEALLDRYVALLMQRQGRVNLIAASTLPQVWIRHVADSLQLLTLAPDARHWVDLGSGGGFPGIPIACALSGTPGAAVHLVESIGKKAAFLQETVRMLGVPALVHHQRIADFVAACDETPDIVTARALAPLTGLLAEAEPLLKKGARGLFLKGRNVEAELTEASSHWDMELTLVPSRTDADGRIVVVTRATRR